jgi:hypothetical protein
VFPLFAADVVDTGGKFAAGVVAPVHIDLYRYLREFSKKFEMTLMQLSETWGKMIYEKNQKQKISLTLFPLIRYCPEDTWLKNSLLFLSLRYCLNDTWKRILSFFCAKTRC